MKEIKINRRELGLAALAVFLPKSKIDKSLKPEPLIKRNDYLVEFFAYQTMGFAVIDNRRSLTKD